MQAVAHRVPKWHDDTRRWRLRIGFHFDFQGKRVERPFYWPGQRGDGRPPPAVIAAAVTAQDQWRKIKADWPTISERLRAMEPDRDWSKRVWHDPDVLERDDAAEKAMSDNAVQQAVDEWERQAAADAEAAARWVARNGIAALMERLHLPIPYANDPHYHPGYPTSGHERLDALRATGLAELRPHAHRLMVKPIAIRQAIVASITPYQERTTYRTDRRIEVDTADGHRKNLCGLFGLSSSKEMEVVRGTVDVELRLHGRFYRLRPRAPCAGDLVKD